MSNNEKNIVNPLLTKGRRGITIADEVMSITCSECLDNATTEESDEPKKTSHKVNGWSTFKDGLEKYTGVKGQGSAIWVPTEVKKHIESIRAKASTNIPIRSMAAAMIMAFIEEHRKELSKL